MKKKYNLNKKIMIAMLSVVAVCLAGGLIYYLRVQNHNEAQQTAAEEVAEPEEVIVPEIDTDVKSIPETIKSSASMTEETAKTADDKTEQTISSSTSPEKPVVENEEDLKDSSKKPTYNDAAAKSSEAPQSSTPQTPSTPKDGDIREDGAIYIEGFGWIPYEGENHTIDAPNAGTGNPIGDM